MRIVPVIDLMGGRVVHARGGRRETYRPIESALTGSSEPAAVVEALLALHPFDALYVADLNAIAGEGHHLRVLEDLKGRFPGLALWVDSGLATVAACTAWLARGLGDLVLGSESQEDTAVLARLSGSEEGRRLLLSLDFQGERFLGPAALLNDPRHWPHRVIVMTLGRVGGTAGPDVQRLRALRGSHPERQFYAAGGVRHAEDLRDLASAGAAGALVASALHDGRLDRAALIELRGKNKGGGP